MNTLFSVIFIIATFLLLFLSPATFLEALLDGAGKSATLCLSLIATYAVWMGLMRLWEDSGVTRGISKLLKPFAKKLLKTKDEEALQNACMNFSVNLLGISGAATPYGIKAAQLLDKTEHAEYSSAMLFVLNATSLQVFPTSMIGVRVAMHSLAPNDIVLPTLLATLFSTALGVFLVWAFLRPKIKRRQRVHAPTISTKTEKRKGAGAR
jgi:spore maturation protein A